MLRASYALTALLVLTITTVPAYGYIDSGTGSFIVQVALAGLLGASFMARNVVAVIREKIGRGPRRDEA